MPSKFLIGPSRALGFLRKGASLLTLGVLLAAGAAAYGSGHSYVVKAGDSLWAIARANGITVNQLAAANNMRASDLLLIGRQLQIPTTGSTAGSTPAVTTASATTENPWSFCATMSSSGAPGTWGVLPDLLRQSPDRLALQPLFIKWSRHYNVSLPLLEAIAWQESGWQQGVVSSTGAIGAGQIMPGTASFISGTLIGMPMNINSVNDNIRMSAAFLAYLAGVEGNNRCATIAAYYEGPLNLGTYGIFPDTQAYVASVEALIPRFE
ncbi:MAG TPA: transglycosylase SLT domain-containing protein [Acidimicrobiales bacterium]|nr:transglycosylase SLT domain-containing protein [Acidimicrobiales bacterium]